MKKINELGILVLTLAMTIGMASAADVFVAPSSKIVSQGQTFDLNITVDPKGTVIAGIQLNIAFNKTVLNVNSITEGNLFKKNRASTFFSAGVINNSSGTTVNIFDTILGAFSTSAPGTFITINATAVGSGVSEINLSDVKISNHHGIAVALNVVDGSVNSSLAVLSGVVAPFDLNNDGMIQRTEAVAAILRFFDGDPSVPRSTAIAVIVAFFNGV